MKPITLSPAQLDAALVTVHRPADLCERCDEQAVDSRELRSGREVGLCAMCAEDWDEAEECRGREALEPNACPGCGGTCLRACR